MALLRELTSGRQRVLEPEFLVGRAVTSALCLDNRFVSAQHALIRWDLKAWALKDLATLNGTFLNGLRLEPGREHVLARGSRIAFGKPDHEWELLDDSAPEVMVMPLDSPDPEPVLFRGDMLALPSGEDPRVTIYHVDGSWVVERADESITPIMNQQTFDVAGRLWRFCCADMLVRTSLDDRSCVGLEVRHLQLAFFVSSDEEHVGIHMTCGGRTFDMGSRSHNYVLLTLARRRLADAAQGLGETTCGWIYQEDLVRDPAMQPQQLNIDVFRIRKQFQAVGVIDAAAIVERRPRTRQLRIGTMHISITRL
jgi:hypothetical protein